MKIESAVLHVLSYFAVFEYPPSSDQIHTFLSEKISHKELAGILEKMVKKRNIEALRKSKTRYTAKGNNKFFEQYEKRRKLSEQKIQSVQWFFKLVSFFPAIHFVGISGSLAMLNGKDNDDIDICVITAAGRLWTGRLLTVITAMVLGKKRSYKDANPKDKLCLNLYFDESGMAIPKAKQNEYIAHEILQMKPVVNKYHTYETFLENNSWIQRLFPNVEIPEVPYSDDGWSRGLIPALREMSELVLAKVQLYSINRRRTNEIVTQTQLWFFPDDFEKKLKQKIPDLRSHEK